MNFSRNQIIIGVAGLAAVFCVCALCGVFGLIGIGASSYSAEVSSQVTPRIERLTTPQEPAAMSEVEQPLTPTNAPAGVSPVTEDVIFELVVNHSLENRPILVGTTNLPDETIIATSVSNEATGFLAQQETVIKDGRFEAGPFGPETGLAPGNYIADATMPIPRLQPDSVRAVIGENGEHLTGNHVESGDLGITISTEVAFQVGTDTEVTESNEQVTTEATAIFQELQVLLEKGRGMEALRQSEDNAALEQCGNQMRENQAQAEELRSQAESLPQKYLLLKAATLEISRCVSCSENALVYCDTAASSLEEVGSLLE